MLASTCPRRKAISESAAPCQGSARTEPTLAGGASRSESRLVAVLRCRRSHLFAVESSMRVSRDGSQSLSRALKLRRISRCRLRGRHQHSGRLTWPLPPRRRAAGPTILTSRSLAARGMRAAGLMSDNARAVEVLGARLAIEAISRVSPVREAFTLVSRSWGPRSVASESGLVGVISSPSVRHEGMPKACRNQISDLTSFCELRLSPRAHAFGDEMARVIGAGSRYASRRVRIQYAASARCRATAPIAF
jgi:hypothetical protein